MLQDWLSPAGRARDKEISFAFLCLISLLCRWAHGLKISCKPQKNPWKESKGLGWLLKIISKSLLMEAQGQGLLSHSQHLFCRFAALTSVHGHLLHHTWAWHQTPLQLLAPGC